MDTWIILRNNTNFASFGICQYGELNFIDVNFVRNSHNWGILITYDNSIVGSELFQYTENEVTLLFEIEEKKYSLYVARVPRAYEINLKEM